MVFLMLKQNSILRQVPAAINPKQALFIDGIRHAIEIIDLAYERLSTRKPKCVSGFESTISRKMVIFSSKIIFVNRIIREGIMRGPKPKYAVQLTEEKYQELKHLSLSHMSPWVEVQRARILLLAYEHPDWSNHKIAAEVGCSLMMVKKWRKRWYETNSTKSLPRSGAPRKFNALQKVQTIALACTNPTDHSKPWKRWTSPKLAEVAIEQGIVKSISNRTISRWLRGNKLKPWKYHSWQKPTDPQFIEKAGPILDLYEHSEELFHQNEWVVCIDEKTSIQARKPLDETLPAIPGHPVRVCDRYQRKGALQLFCALTVATGATYTHCFERKLFSNFKLFLRGFFNKISHKNINALHVMLDNSTTHAPKQLEKWLDSLQLLFKVQLYWLPVHASWLDQVEIIFSKLKRELLTPSDFKLKFPIKVSCRHA